MVEVDAGQTVELRVLGLATVADDVTPELALATIAPVEVLAAAPPPELLPYPPLGPGSSRHTAPTDRLTPTSPPEGLPWTTTAPPACPKH